MAQRRRGNKQVDKDVVDMHRIAILQSNYLPWKGVFDLIHRVDTFVFLEDVQYTEHDWRNRNKIMTDQQTKWITVPVKNAGRFCQLICETELDNRTNWQRKHLHSFQTYYARAPYFKQYRYLIEDLYLQRRWTRLSELNIYATQMLARVLEIRTRFVNSCDLSATGVKDDRIIEICKELGATHYLSGPAAQNYIHPEKFTAHNIQLEYIQYQYPGYSQVYQPFSHQVTVLDLIFNCGPRSAFYIWGWRELND